METLKIPTNYSSNSILIADDEPEHLEWLVDYLEQKNFFVEVATNVLDAVRLAEKQWYRAYIIDLNIPLNGWPASIPASSTFEEYPGLHIVRAVRSQGNEGGRVVVYSAHFNEQITAEIKTLYCEYVVKGRPRELKDKIGQILRSRDKTAAVAARTKRRPVAKNPRRAPGKLASSAVKVPRKQKSALVQKKPSKP